MQIKGETIQIVLKIEYKAKMNISDISWSSLQIFTLKETYSHYLKYPN